MRIIILIFVIMTLSLQVPAQTTVNLWPEGAPQDNGNDNVAELTVHPANSANNTGKAIVICPGGGYAKLAMDHEGNRVAAWLAENGVTAAVLKYRLPYGDCRIPESDAREAMRYVRRNADKWGVNRAKVGIMGSSAGGHLAATVATTEGDAESQPNFSVLFYPVISSDPAISHKGSFRNLLGEQQSDAKMLEHYSLDRQVTKDTPPALLLLSDDDKGVSPLNSIRYYNALKDNGVAASMHIFPIGGHGWGFNYDFKYLPVVKDTIIDWIGRQ